MIFEPCECRSARRLKRNDSVLGRSRRIEDDDLGEFDARRESAPLVDDRARECTVGEPGADRCMALCDDDDRVEPGGLEDRRGEECEVKARSKARAAIFEGKRTRWPAVSKLAGGFA